ncbi:redoxin domain-containing protein [Leptolyngbya sp. NK1-12]|uniref:Redoxin domain-containing protein n=1 Tax=Leptolyngbya sp. NK1-12 TaxID=2547451 RepID=A0AA96WCP7_9CYAN|nr:redoxin domain-containing protein [Leptolyngbya sp. NK1-12]
MALAVNELTFKHEVLASSTPVLVSFWAPWCGVCRLVNPMLAELQTEWGGQIKLVSINADENLRLASAHKLTTLPTVMLFDQGKVLCRLDQFKGREDFRRAATDLQTVLQRVMLRYSYSA